jgi:hypothetical protein
VDLVVQTRTERITQPTRQGEAVLPGRGLGLERAFGAEPRRHRRPRSAGGHEPRRNLHHRCESPLGNRVEASLDHVCHCGCYCRIEQLHGSVEQASRVRRLRGFGAGRDQVQERTETVDVVGNTGSASTGLLWRHVAVRTATVLAGRIGHGRVARARQFEIQQAQPPVGGDHHVRRFDVTVDQPFAVNGVEHAR